MKASKHNITTLRSISVVCWLLCAELNGSTCSLWRVLSASVTSLRLTHWTPRFENLRTIDKFYIKFPRKDDESLRCSHLCFRCDSNGTYAIWTILPNQWMGMRTRNLIIRNQRNSNCHFSMIVLNLKTWLKIMNKLLVSWKLPQKNKTAYLHWRPRFPFCCCIFSRNATCWSPFA